MVFSCFRFPLQIYLYCVVVLLLLFVWYLGCIYLINKVIYLKNKWSTSSHTLLVFQHIILFVGVNGDPSTSHNFTFNFPFHHEILLQWFWFQGTLLMFNVLLYGSHQEIHNVSSKMSLALILNFWNCWMWSIAGPFFLIFSIWVKKELLLISS